MNKQQFRELHHQKQPLLLANVWDAASAKLGEELGFQAVGTSSAAIASSLGFEDGEKISFHDLLFVVDKIIKSISIPLTVDIENGYGQNVKDIANNITELSRLGVVGINLEDSKVADTRGIIPVDEFQKLLTDLEAELNIRETKIFINVRTDAFLLQLPHMLKETLARIEAYETAGVDGFFIPGVTSPADIRAIVSCTNTPINVMAMPGLPSFKELESLRVKRISMGNFIYDAVLTYHKKSLQQILKYQSFNPLFDK